MSKRYATMLTAAGLAVAICIAGCSSSKSKSSSSGSGASGNSGQSVSLVEYSVPKPAYDALGAAFEKTAAGKGVSFKASYGPSGTQSKDVSPGQQGRLRRRSRSSPT